MNGFVVVDSTEIAAFVQDMHATASFKRQVQIEQIVEDFLVWRFKKKGPASAPTLPSHGSSNPPKDIQNMGNNTTPAAAPARTDADISFETDLYDLQNMAGIAAWLMSDTFSTSHENVTGHPDKYHLAERQREHILFAVVNTEARARALVAAYERGGISI